MTKAEACTCAIGDCRVATGSLVAGRTSDVRSSPLPNAKRQPVRCRCACACPPVLASRAARSAAATPVHAAGIEVSTPVLPAGWLCVRSALVTHMARCTVHECVCCAILLRIRRVLGVAPLAVRAAAPCCVMCAVLCGRTVPASGDTRYTRGDTLCSVCSHSHGVGVIAWFKHTYTSHFTFTDSHTRDSYTHIR
jgi:hypothetical protein